jgi:hypothetical protein
MHIYADPSGCSPQDMHSALPSKVPLLGIESLLGYRVMCVFIKACRPSLRHNLFNVSLSTVSKYWMTEMKFGVSQIQCLTLSGNLFYKEAHK